MTENIKRKPFDMTNVLKNAVAVDKIPSIAHRGKSSIDWKPLINLVKQKGTVRLSENDVVIGSVINGIKKEAERQSVEIVTNTRKIDGKLYLYIQKPIKRDKVV